MKRIRTRNEPTPGLAKYRQTAADPSWSGFRRLRHQRAYRELRNALLDLQHGLCAYCEASLDEERCQIEHVVPRSDPRSGAHRELDVANMVVGCLGGAEAGPPGDVGSEDDLPLPSSANLSCGQKKGGRVSPDFMDPRAIPAAPALVRVDGSGRIESDAASCRSAGASTEQVTRTVEFLNLNAARLRQERRRRWRSLVRRATAARDRRTREAWVRSELLPGRDDRLVGFLSTARSFFGPLGERILAEPPRDWI